MKLSIKTNAKTFEQSLKHKADKQIPYAGMAALNNVAFKIRAAEQEAMDKHLANPTPFAGAACGYARPPRNTWSPMYP